MVAGILMAPSNGKESREGILRAASQLADSVNGQIAPYLEKLSGLSSMMGSSEGKNTTSTSVGADNTAGTTADGNQA